MLNTAAAQAAGTTIAEFGSQTITLASLAAALGLKSTAAANPGTPTGGAIAVGPGLTGGGLLAGGIVTIGLAGPFPAMLPEDGAEGEMGFPGPPGLSTPGVRGPSGLSGPPGEDASEPDVWMIPGSPGVGTPGARGLTGPLGPPGEDASEPDVWMIPGPPGASGASGAGGSTGGGSSGSYFLLDVPDPDDPLSYQLPFQTNPVFSSLTVNGGSTLTTPSNNQLNVNALTGGQFSTINFQTAGATRAQAYWDSVNNRTTFTSWSTASAVVQGILQFSNHTCAGASGSPVEVGIGAGPTFVNAVDSLFCVGNTRAALRVDFSGYGYNYFDAAVNYFRTAAGTAVAMTDGNGMHAVKYNNATGTSQYLQMAADSGQAFGSCVVAGTGPSGYTGIAMSGTNLSTLMTDGSNLTGIYHQNASQWLFYEAKTSGYTLFTYPLTTSTGAPYMKSNVSGAPAQGGVVTAQSGGTPSGGNSGDVCFVY